MRAPPGFWLALLLALWPAAAVAQDVAAAAHAYRAAADELSRHMELNWLDDDPASPGRLEAVWKAEQAWTNAWLNGHPDAKPAEFSSAIKASMPGMDPRPLSLDARSYLVETQHGEMGQVFVVTRRAGAFATAWSTAQAGAESPRGSPLKDWSPARHPCDPDEVGCWPLYGGASLLLPDARGRPRFAIQAFNAGMGETLGAQTSIWVWTGATAELLFLKRHAAFIDGGPPLPRPPKDVYQFAVKGEFRSFATTSGDSGRELAWRVKLTPTGVRDLGGVSLTPEADLADALFQRVLHHRDASDLATPQVVATVRRGFRHAGEPDEEFGMATRTVRGGLLLCLDTGPTFLFTLDPSGRKPAIRGARELKSGECVRDWRAAKAGG
jgi:hypothetical protein